MRKSLVTALVLVFLIVVTPFAVTVLSVKAESQMIVVPDDYSSITAALNNAADGDIVFVKEGTYLEHQLNLNKSITLTGEDANNTVITNIDSRSWDLSLDTFPPPAPTAIEISANNVRVTGFTITCKDGWWAPIAASANNSVITGNIISKSGGISVTGNNNTIAQNLFKPDVLGTFLVCDSSYNLIADNTMSKDTAETNVYLSVGGSSNLIYNNTLKSTSVEVSGNFNTLAKNKITNGGIELDYPASNNKIISNTKIDCLTLMGFNDVIEANDIANVEIGGTHGGSIDAANNSFYHNNFLGIAPELRVSTKSPGTLIWDNGSEGNYWSNYKGTAANGGGIGNEPYQITAGYTYFDGAVREDSIVNCGQDNFPLMVPFNISSVNVQLPDWALTSASLQVNPSPEPTLRDQQESTSPTPFPTTITAIALGSSVGIVAVGLICYFRKRKL